PSQQLLGILVVTLGEVFPFPTKLLGDFSLFLTYLSETRKAGYAIDYGKGVGAIFTAKRTCDHFLIFFSCDLSQADSAKAIRTSEVLKQSFFHSSLFGVR